MASTPGQTSGAVLTLLPESQLAFALPPTSSPTPCWPPGGASASNEPRAKSLLLWLPPLSSCRSSTNVCLINEHGQDTAHLEDVLSSSQTLKAPQLPSPLVRKKPLWRATVPGKRGQTDGAELGTEASFMSFSWNQHDGRKQTNKTATAETSVCIDVLCVGPL